MITAQDIADEVGGTVVGDASAQVAGVSTLGRSEPGRLCFARDLDQLSAADTAAGAVVLAPPGAGPAPGLILIEVPDPRLAFALAVKRFFAQPEEARIAESAHIDPTARLGRDVSVGEGCVLGAGVSVGDGSILRHHVVLGPGVRIGARCVVGSHSVIGEVGFGLARDDDGRGVRIPHLGSVEIGDDVEIGALSSIAAGTIEPTRIEDGVRIDDQVFIAHNCVLERNVIVIACAEISGSVRIGRNSWIGPNVSIRDGLRIAPDCLIGIGSTVVKSIDQPGIYAGSPARLLRKEAAEGGE
jgi:UDP-3-O-[3-hydroxymyristoyl] glucosamine N-acyltransferase LpxD